MKAPAAVKADQPCTPEALIKSGLFIISVEEACRYLNIGRTLGFQLARERGELCEGVKVLRVGRLLKVPVKPLLSALGYDRKDGET